MLARTIRMKPLPLAAAAALLVSVLSGCNSGHHDPVTDGPLSSGSPPTHAEACADARVGQALTFGLEQFTNHGRRLVVLDRVTLQRPHHERLVGSYAVPGYVGIGVEVSWPPKNADIRAAWKRRQPVHGFRVAPGKSFTMVLGVAGTRVGTATSQGMLIYYHNASISYVTKDELAMNVAAGKKKC
jgi:hypothetical protein